MCFSLLKAPDLPQGELVEGVFKLFFVAIRISERRKTSSLGRLCGLFRTPILPTLNLKILIALKTKRFVYIRLRNSTEIHPKLRHNRSALSSLCVSSFSRISRGTLFMSMLFLVVMLITMVR